MWDISYTMKEKAGAHRTYLFIYLFIFYHLTKYFAAYRMQEAISIPTYLHTLF